MAIQDRPRRHDLSLSQAPEQLVLELGETLQELLRLQVWLQVKTEGIFRRQQTHDRLGGVPQLGIALQVSLDADRLSSAEAKLQFGMNQLDQHGLALDGLLAADRRR